MKKREWFFKNIVIAIIIAGLIIYLSSLALKVITRHNKELEVPNFKGMSVTEALDEADKYHLRLEVRDSLYLPRLERGEIFRQNPEAGTKVKKNRRVLLTINSFQPKKVNMPSLVGYSLRQAKAELSLRQLKVGRLIYVPDIANNNVVAQLYRGRAINSGTPIEVESAIDLEVGISQEGFETSIPTLRGFPLETAKEILIDNSLNIGRVIFDKSVKSMTDSLAAFVYRQNPAPSDTLLYRPGTPVELSLTIDSSKVVIK